MALYWPAAKVALEFTDVQTTEATYPPGTIVIVAEPEQARDEKLVGDVREFVMDRIARHAHAYWQTALETTQKDQSADSVEENEAIKQAEADFERIFMGETEDTTAPEEASDTKVRNFHEPLEDHEWELHPNRWTSFTFTNCEKVRIG